MTPFTQPAIITTPAPSRSVVVVRPLAVSDSIGELTALLHRAYRPQVEMGLRPLAGRQSEDITRTRVAAGECYVAVAEGDARLLGTILLQEKEDAGFPAHFLNAGVAHFSLLAVDPDSQGRGVGSRLIKTAERRAAELGFRELACSMAEPDAALLSFYLRHGFAFVEHWQWPYTNYRSAILSRPIG